MLDFHHYFNRSLVGFITLAVVVITFAVVVVPVVITVLDAAHALSDLLSNGLKP